MMIRRIKNYLSRWLNDKPRRNIIEKLLFLAHSVYKKTDSIMRRTDNRIVAKFYIRLKSIERQLRAKCTFVTIEELMHWTNEWIKTFPQTYDVIVGVPRSGLLIANMIALRLGKPLATPEQFKEGKYWISDHNKDRITKSDELCRVLLVDDCIKREKTIEEPAEILRSSGRNIQITKAVLMVRQDAVKCVDLYYKILHNCPPVSEWNLIHWKRGKLAVDMNGVICEDCPVHIDNEDELYGEWLENARPYLIPTFSIDYIVSCRLEKYRSATEEWRDRYGVKYDRLILWDIQSKEDRKRRFSEHKIDVLLKIKPELYWESNYHQSKKIWKSTGIPTICIDEMIAFGTIKK